MIDAEVERLRRLRNVALRSRAMAEFLKSDRHPNDSVFDTSALICWGVVRIATGHLRAHPYLSYQKGPSRWHGLLDLGVAAVTGLLAQYRNRRLSLFESQLHSLKRELDDARALTRSAQLSDALGRLQTQMRRMLMEVTAGARAETGSLAGPRGEAGTRTALQGRTLPETQFAGDWPYLAF
jgi:hypothetical protein